MHEEKTFLTYNQQLRKLRNEKNIDCEGTKDKTLLVRAGYFNIVNGYKDPFICDKDINGKHIYISGTTLEHLHELKRFDDELRLFLLKYITQIEEEVRTIFGYKFDQCNKSGKIPWYDAKAYSESSRLQNRMSAISSAYSELSKSQLEYVRHYMENHLSIPTWIMIKVVNFSTFINILKNSKMSVTHSICYLYDITDEKELPNVKLLIGSLHWLRKIRNACAHNERIFSLKQKEIDQKPNTGRIKEKYIKQLSKSYSRESEKRLFDLLVYFKYYLPDKEYKNMIEEIQTKLEKIKGLLQPNAFDNIRGQMGIKSLEDLEILKNLPKKTIKYHSFDKEN